MTAEAAEETCLSPGTPVITGGGYYKDLDAAYDRIDLSFTGRLEPTTLHKEKIEKAYRLFKKVDENLQSVYSVEKLPG